MTNVKSDKYNAGVVAKLANLSLSDKDLVYLGNQLTISLNYVSKVQAQPTAHVEPTSQVTGLENIFRDDIVEPSLSQEEALKNAPHIYNGFFVVKAIFTE